MFETRADRRRRLDTRRSNRGEPEYAEHSDPARGRLVTRVGRQLAIATFGFLVVFGVLVLATSHLISPVLGVVVLAVCAPGGAVLVSRRSVRELRVLFSHEDRLVRSLAHEIRRPLQRLFAVADLGVERSIEPEVALPEVLVHAENLNQLLEDLFEAAQLISGSRPLETEESDLVELISGARAQLGDSRLEVTVVGDPEVFRVNPRLLRLLLTNLLRNAAAHAYGGSGGEVVITIGRRGFRVRDRGVGIDPKQLAVIRHALGQSFRRTGAGVGLSLTAWVVDIHGGELTIENHPEGGTEVRVDLTASGAS